MIRLQNLTNETKQLHIHEFAANEILDIDNSWYIDAVITAISNNEFCVHNDKGAITSLISQLEWLKGGIKTDANGAVVIAPNIADNKGRQYVRNVATEPEYHYSPRSLDFYTAKHKSLYNKNHYGDGTIDGSEDLGDAWVKYFNADNVELVQGESESDEDYQTRLTSDCTKTNLYFEPTFDYDVFGAKLQFRNIPQDRAYFWFVAAPDIPAEYGGNVVFMGGGMNVSFFNEKDTFECDGKTVSKIVYDNVYHSGKVVLIVKHNPGVQIGIQLIYQFYS